MENAYSRLLKVLTLERKQGYRNKAVIGGLDKFATRWESDARAAYGNQALIGEIVALLIGYPVVEDPVARERILDLIVRRMGEVEDVPAGSGPNVPGEATWQATAGRAPGREHRERPAESSQGSGQAPRLAPTEDEARPVVPKLTRPVPPPRPPQPSGEPTQKPLTGASEMPRHDAAPPSRPSVPRLDRPGGRDWQGVAREPSGESAGRHHPEEPAPAQSHRAAGGPASDRAKTAQPAKSGEEFDAWGAAGPLSEPEEPAAVGESREAKDPAAEGAQDSLADAETAETEGGETAAGAPNEEPAWPVHLEAEDEAALAAEPPAAWAAPQPRPGAMPRHGLDAPVTKLPSIGPSLAEKLAKLGVQTVRDLLYLLPRRYEDYSTLRTIDMLHFGEEVTIIGTVWQIHTRPLSENRKMTTAVVGDGTGEIQMTWFNPFVERQLRSGRAYLFSGKIDSFRGQLQMRSPEFEALDSLQINTGRLVPIYPLTAGITARWLRRVMKNTVDAWAGGMPDFMPAAIRQEWGLMPLGSALAEIHFPENNNLLAAARRRLSFDEFFVLQLGVLGARQRFRGQPARALQAGPNLLAPFLSNLPFALTGAQERVLREITADLGCAQPMSRLLQGDVGSGKTAVAAAALWLAVANGTQGAIMAPTEILAEQHARSFGTLFAGLNRPGSEEPVRVALFTGRQRKAERDEALAALAAGEIDIAVGTHALIQDEIAFKELSVAVVDEQHRFGVEQRAALRQKGTQPHMLVMSATPIPRSLALTLYGDLDVAVIDEMPAGRTPVKTKWLTPAQRERAYSFIRRQVEAGRQVFIIYPLVEETENGDGEPESRAAGRAAVEEHERLQKSVFPDLRLGLLHGRMKGDEKDAVMRSFAAGELDILVSTSVVEVGIDVPNATVIAIEGAERFGLAQLHQFRGRVGRGEFPSYCILISDTGEGEGAQRLQALETSNDGFALAQTDLEMRGPGDFLGTRQSGLPPLQTAQLSDLRTLEEARSAAQKLFSTDPQLSLPEHRGIAERVAEFWHGAGDVS